MQHEYVAGCRRKNVGGGGKQESQRQVEVEKALVDVKVLKRDLEGEAKRLGDKQQAAERQAAKVRGPAAADAQAALKKVRQQIFVVRAGIVPAQAGVHV